MSFALFGSSRDNRASAGSGPSASASCPNTRPAGLRGARLRRRCSGALRASHQDVADAPATAVITNTPAMAMRSVGGIGSVLHVDNAVDSKPADNLQDDTGAEQLHPE